MRFSCIPLGLLSWLVCCRHTMAKLVNVTIDDKLGDPKTGAQVSYSPVDAWNDGADCSNCTAKPDRFNMFYGTWHDSTFNANPGSNEYPNTTLTASADFNGTAVYVFCALSRTTQSPSGNSDMSFYIDDALTGTFVKPAPGSAGFDYNTSVFSATSLPPGPHTLKIQNGHVNGLKSLLILDSIVYTYDDGTPFESSLATAPYTPYPKPATIGAIVATAVVVALLGLAFFLWRRRRHHHHHVNVTRKELVVDTFTVPPAPQGAMFDIQPSHLPSGIYHPQLSALNGSNFVAGTATVTSQSSINGYMSSSSHQPNTIPSYFTPSSTVDVEEAPPAYDYDFGEAAASTNIRHQKRGGSQ